MSRHESPCRPSNGNEKPTCCRLTVLGGAAVGKTALLKRFLNDEFVEKYRETVEDLHIRTFHVNGRAIQAHIFDTAGNIQFPAMRRLSIGNAQAFLLVYDVSSEGSFRILEGILRDIKDVRNESEMRELPIVIAANKCDLPQEQWAVTSQMIDEFMLNETMDCRAVHLETSAKTGYNNRMVFESFIKISPMFLNQPVTRLPATAPAALTTSFDFVNSTTLNGVGQWGVVADPPGRSPMRRPRLQREDRRFSLQTLSLRSSASHHGGYGTGIGAWSYSMAPNRTEVVSGSSTPEHGSPRRFRVHSGSFCASGQASDKSKGTNERGFDEATELRKCATAGSRRRKFFKARDRTKSECDIPECYVQ